MKSIQLFYWNSQVRNLSTFFLEIFKETFLKITKNAQNFFKSKDIEKGLLFFNKSIDMLGVQAFSYKIVRKEHSERSYQQVHKSDYFC